MKNKILSVLLVLVLSMTLVLSVSASSGTTFVYDEADLLSSRDESQLNERLMELSRTYNAQIVIVTVPQPGMGDVDYYFEYRYDSEGYGYGENRDGVMLLVCMNPREYRILSNGFASHAIDTGDISDIGDVIVSDLSDANYASAFDKFADRCDYYLNGYINGFPFEAGESLLIALIIGIVVGVIVAFVLKGQLKSVRSQYRAHEYIKPGSMHVTAAHDFFLYRNITRTKKETSSSSGRSGGGGSRSTGGGSF